MNWTAIPILPPNPYFNYYGSAWDIVLFTGFLVTSIMKFRKGNLRRGIYLVVFTYCCWELIDVTYSNPFEVVYFALTISSFLVIRENSFFKNSWKALSVVLGYRIATASYAFQTSLFGPGQSCGLNLCAGTNLISFALGQIIYTILVFAWVNESLGSPLLPKLRENSSRMLAKITWANIK